MSTSFKNPERKFAEKLGLSLITQMDFSGLIYENLDLNTIFYIELIEENKRSEVLLVSGTSLLAAHTIKNSKDLSQELNSLLMNLIDEETKTLTKLKSSGHVTSMFLDFAEDDEFKDYYEECLGEIAAELVLACKNAEVVQSRHNNIDIALKLTLSDPESVEYVTIPLQNGARGAGRVLLLEDPNLLDSFNWLFLS